MNTLSNLVTLLTHLIMLFQVIRIRDVIKLRPEDFPLSMRNPVTEQPKLNDEYPLTGTLAKIPLTGSVLVNESTPPLRDQRRYLIGSTVTESRPNAKPNSVIDTGGEPNE